ncbi:hypothetical protein PCL_06664 [Purpureocillium lilacinum]|uniref:Uncharacterized protein n=1 Tax=Purpureocillium lilacinum TaxID=33203 RepID=A0A2U3ENC4_PURLI|nr:hypothetical protein PCL_06664 [Purpureocillium lilacinum]
MNIESRVADGKQLYQTTATSRVTSTSASPSASRQRIPRCRPLQPPPSHVVIGAPPAIELPLQLRPLSVAGLSSPSAPIASFLHHQRVMQSIPWILPDNSTFSAPPCAIVLPRQPARPSPPPSLRHMSNRQLYRFTCRAASSSLNGTSTCTVSKLIVP